MVFGEFVDKHFAIPNLSLVNKPDLMKILKAEIFVHTDGQLRTAHLILGCNPLSSSFQSPKCVIKAKDLLLHQINIAVPGFLVIGPILEGVQQIELPFLRAVEEEATPSQATIKEEEVVVEISESKDDFEIFNQPLPSEPLVTNFSQLLPAQVSHTQEDSTVPNAMVIQHKSKSSLLDLLEAMCPKRPFRPSSPPFPLLKLPNLTMLTRRGRWTKRERRWWRKERAFPPRRLSLRGQLKRPKLHIPNPQAKGPWWRGGLIAKSRYQLRTPL